MNILGIILVLIVAMALAACGSSPQRYVIRQHIGGTYTIDLVTEDRR